MLVKVELHPDVVWDLQNRFTAEEVDEFYQKLHSLRERPIENSEPLLDRDVSPFMLRRFAFGKGIEKVAVFKYDIAKNRIRVIKCRLSKPPRRRNGKAKGKEPGP